MSTASVTRSPTAGASSGSKRAMHLALAEAHDDDRLRAGRLDHLDRRLEKADLAAAAARPGSWRVMFSGRMPKTTRRPASAEPFAGPLGRKRQDQRLAAAVAERDAGRPSAATISAGRKFIAGEPMKPATNMLAGRS